MPSIHCPKGHPTITARFSAHELAEADIALCDTPDHADVIVAALVEELVPAMQRFGPEKKYLIWCDEPLWSHIFQKIDSTRAAFVVDVAGSHQPILVDAMNCFTGNVLFSNHHFLLGIYHLDSASFAKVPARHHDPLPPAGERRIAAFLTYRNGGFWDFRHPSGSYGLNTLRSRVALEGALFDKVDVYGQGWPFNLAKPEEEARQEGADLFALKVAQYQKYRFALCFENTWSPYYVTEKIWQTVLAGCLPIYHAGPQHTVYQDFPKGSFIDYADFEHPSPLFAAIDGMTQEEFDRRLILCRAALQHAIALSRDGEVPRRLQRAMFAERVKTLTMN